MHQLTDEQRHERFEMLMARRQAKLDNVRYRNLKTARWSDYLVY